MIKFFSLHLFSDYFAIMYARFNFLRNWQNDDDTIARKTADKLLVNSMPLNMMFFSTILWQYNIFNCLYIYIHSYIIIQYQWHYFICE